MCRTSGIVTSTVSRGITPPVCVALQLLVDWPGQSRSHVNASPLPPCFQNSIPLFGMLYCSSSWMAHHYRIYHEFFIISEGALKM